MFKCDICGLEFESGRAYAGHKGSHTRLGKKRVAPVSHQCANCENSTTNKKYCSMECSRIGRRRPDVKIRDSRGGQYVSLLGITRDGLNQYRESVTVCEICGHPERAQHYKTGKVIKLAVDHDHNTLQFRGLLCRRCNGLLEWYESNMHAIEAYMQRAVSPLADNELKG